MRTLYWDCKVHTVPVIQQSLGTDGQRRLWSDIHSLSASLWDGRKSLVPCIPTQKKREPLHGFILQTACGTFYSALWAHAELDTARGHSLQANLIKSQLLFLKNLWFIFLWIIQSFLLRPTLTDLDCETQKKNHSVQFLFNITWGKCCL